MTCTRCITPSACRYRCQRRERRFKLLLGLAIAAGLVGIAIGIGLVRPARAAEAGLKIAPRDPDVCELASITMPGYVVHIDWKCVEETDREYVAGRTNYMAAWAHIMIAIRDGKVRP